MVFEAIKRPNNVTRGQIYLQIFNLGVHLFAFVSQVSDLVKQNFELCSRRWQIKTYRQNLAGHTQFPQKRLTLTIHDTRCKWTGIENASKWGIYQQYLMGVFGNLATLAPGQVVPENLFRYNSIEFFHQPWNLWNFLSYLITFGALLPTGTRNSKFWWVVKMGRKKLFVVFCGKSGSMYESRGIF